MIPPMARMKFVPSRIIHCCNRVSLARNSYYVMSHRPTSIRRIKVYTYTERYYFARS